ncbi:MAG: molybdopterin-dependent oxidoreductase [Cocleimonas sp.]|nr:molybdopterin-dependent oxidoreductase [Cocleimonas sp.]
MITNETTHKPTVCPLDCPDTCSLTAVIESGKLMKVKGSRANPLTGGVICGKVAKYYPNIIHGSARLKTPLKRTGKRGSGQYEAISWRMALDICHQKMQHCINEYGSESILPLNYSGPHGQLAGGSMDRRFFYKLGATQLNRSPLCAGTASLARQSLFGDTVGMPQQQAVHSDLIIIWGCNITTSYLHLMKIINKARHQGAKLIVIDPKRIKIAKIADLFLQVTPGSDAYFALAMATEFDRLGMIDKEKIAPFSTGLEQYLQHASSYKTDQIKTICGIDQQQVKQFLTLFANAKSVSMQVGIGLERTRNGGSAVRAAMALQVLSGHRGKLGQGIMGNYGASFSKTPDRLQRPDLLSKPTRTFNIIDVADHILDRDVPIPIKSVFIYNHNPVITHPDQNKMRQALSLEDVFIVGCDLLMTDSMKYADIILPACSHFEHSDVYAAYGHSNIQRANAVINPVGEALPNTEIFRRLAQRFKFKDKAFKDSDEELLEQAFDLSQQKQKNIKDLAEDHIIPTLDTDHIWLSDMPEDNKITFYSDSLQQQYGYGLPRYENIDCLYPYQLITAASPQRTNALFGSEAGSMALQEVEINPDDAKYLNIETGQTVMLVNHKGEVILVAKVTTDVAKGVLSTDKGAWCESSPTGQSANALIDNQSKTDIGDGAAYYDTFVEIRLIDPQI